MKKRKHRARALVVAWCFGCLVLMSRTGANAASPKAPSPSSLPTIELDLEDLTNQEMQEVHEGLLQALASDGEGNDTNNTNDTNDTLDTLDTLDEEDDAVMVLNSTDPPTAEAPAPAPAGAAGAPRPNFTEVTKELNNSNKPEVQVRVLPRDRVAARLCCAGDRVGVTPATRRSPSKNITRLCLVSRREEGILWGERERRGDTHHSPHPTPSHPTHHTHTHTLPSCR